MQTENPFIPPAYSYTKNYACLLPPLANVNWSAFLECFFANHVIHDWWNGTRGGLQFGCGELILFPLSVYVCLGLVVEYWPFVDTCTHHSYSKLYCLCHLASLFKFLPPPIPSPCPSHLPPISNVTGYGKTYIVHTSDFVHLEIHKKLEQML